MNDQVNIQPCIFIADDDADDVSFVERAIRQLDLNISVKHFFNGKELLLALSERTDDLPNFVVLDLNMPVMDGREALRQIRKNVLLDSLPVIILSTSSYSIERSDCLRSGANNYFTKPYTFGKYLEIFRQLKSDWIDGVRV